ncbi:MAG: hypothetical protein JWN78_2877 [Bacteroidota bacterium]|nr:hypothetical protein [Bacteroidota bacterium]
MKNQTFLCIIFLSATVLCCKKSDPAKTTNPVLYDSVVIGSQVWMLHNLAVSTYRNGDAIPTGLSNMDWQNATNGAFTEPDNNSANEATYGKLYNWYAVSDSRNICPAGWHVPTNAELITLTSYLGGLDSAGGKLKATTLWSAPNTGATNSTEFTGLPAGFRHPGGTFFDIGNSALWWSSTGNGTTTAFDLNLTQSSSHAFLPDNDKHYGFSVRCIRD